MVKQRGKASIRKTVSLDPFVERMIRRNEAEMLNHGWRNANFSLSLNIIVLSTFFDHAAGDQSMHRETIKRLSQWASGAVKLDEKDTEKWDRWIAKVVSQPEAAPNSKE